MKAKKKKHEHIVKTDCTFRELNPSPYTAFPQDKSNILPSQHIL